MKKGLSQLYKREYKAWNMIKNACLVKTNKKYHLYGGKGIILCEEWHEFDNFINDMGKMTDEQDGLILADEKKGYNKFNAIWGKKKRGCPAQSEKKQVKPKKRVIKNSMSFCMSIDHDHYAYIKRQAIMRSQQTGDMCSTNDLIREALIKTYPYSGQYDLFGTKK